MNGQFKSKILIGLLFIFLFFPLSTTAVTILPKTNSKLVYSHPQHHQKPTEPDTTWGYATLGVTYAYTRLISSTLNYGVLGPTVNTPDNANGQALAVSPENHNSYGLHLGYLSPDQTNFVILKYRQFQDEDSDSAAAGPNEVIFTTLIPADFLDDNANVASALAKYSFDFLDLVTGHVFNTPAGNFKLVLGLNWSLIKNLFIANYSGNNITAGITETVSQKNTFSGTGPEIGFGYQHDLFAGINISGDTFFRFPVGKLKYRYEARGEISTEHIDVVNNNTGTIVPILSARIALSRGFKFLTQHKNLIFTLGYQVVWAINSQRFNSYPDSVVPAETSTMEGMGYQGPFFVISVVI